MDLMLAILSDVAYDLLLDESNIRRDLRIINDGEMCVMGQRVKVEYHQQYDKNGEECILSTLCFWYRI